MLDILDDLGLLSMKGTLPLKLSFKINYSKYKGLWQGHYVVIEVSYNEDVCWVLYDMFVYKFFCAFIYDRMSLPEHEKFSIRALQTEIRMEQLNNEQSTWNNDVGQQYLLVLAFRLCWDNPFKHVDFTVSLFQPTLLR